MNNVVVALRAAAEAIARAPLAHITDFSVHEHHDGSLDLSATAEGRFGTRSGRIKVSGLELTHMSSAEHAEHVIRTCVRNLVIDVVRPSVLEQQNNQINRRGNKS